MLKILEASDKISGRSAYSRVSDQLLKRLAAIKDGDKPRYEVAHIPMGKAFNMGKWITRENITIYPSGNTPFAEDVMVEHYVDFGADILITLKEPWVFHSIYKMAVNFVPNAIIDHSPVSPYITNALHTTFKTIAVSRFGQRELKQAGIDNVEYIPHGVDSKVFRPLEEHKKDCKKMWHLDDDDFTVLLVARNQARKQIPHQMRIYQRFREMNPDVKSHLYLWTEARPSTELTEDTVTPLGQADLGVNLMPEMMALGIMQSVRFPEETDLIKKGLDDWVGDVYGPDQKSYDMVKLYNCADVLLGCTGGEGFFLPGIEAQLCGIPEVVTDYAAQPETLGAGYLIPWTTNDNRPDYDVSNSAGVRYVKANIDRAAEALTKVMNGDRAKISRRARQFAMRYDWDRVINEHVVPFLDLCESELRPKLTKEEVSKWTQT